MVKLQNAASPSGSSLVHMTGLAVMRGLGRG